MWITKKTIGNEKGIAASSQRWSNGMGRLRITPIGDDATVNGNRG
ncbi:hypothetical protein [Citrobacter portucalensis]